MKVECKEGKLFKKRVCVVVCLLKWTINQDNVVTKGRPMKI